MTTDQRSSGFEKLMGMSFEEFASRSDNLTERQKREPKSSEHDRLRLWQRIVGRGIIIFLWAVVLGAVFVFPNWYFRLWPFTAWGFGLVCMVAPFLFLFTWLCESVESWCSVLAAWSGWSKDMLLGLGALLMLCVCLYFCFGVLPWVFDGPLHQVWDFGLTLPYYRRG